MEHKISIRKLLERLINLPLGKGHNFKDDRLVTIIDLFYNKGGFEGILKYYETIKDSIGDEVFYYRFGKELFKIINQLIQLKVSEKDLYEYTINNVPTGWRNLHCKKHQDFNIFIFNLMYEKKLLKDFFHFSKCEFLEIIEIDNVIMYIFNEIGSKTDIKFRYDETNKNDVFIIELLKMDFTIDNLLNECNDENLSEEINKLLINIISKLNLFKNLDF